MARGDMAMFRIRKYMLDETGRPCMYITHCGKSILTGGSGLVMWRIGLGSGACYSRPSNRNSVRRSLQFTSTHTLTKRKEEHPERQQVLHDLGPDHFRSLM